MPKMVLAQFGSSDITQSKLASQKVTAKTIKKVTDRRTFFAGGIDDSGVSECPEDLGQVVSK
jgi:hypothetical protein